MRLSNFSNIKKLVVKIEVVKWDRKHIYHDLLHSYEIEHDKCISIVDIHRATTLVTNCIIDDCSYYTIRIESGYILERVRMQKNEMLFEVNKVK